MSLLYCSASPPFEGVNFAASAMYESAYDLIAVVKVVKVLVDEAKVPGAIEESKRAKKG